MQAPQMRQTEQETTPNAVKRRYTLSKEERICSKILIDKLFGGGKSRSMAAFPLRAVYLLNDTITASQPTQLMDNTEGEEVKEGYEEVQEGFENEQESNNEIDKVETTQPRTAAPSVKIMVSVPKKHFKRAVKRNRVKRQVREAYRKNKYILIDKMAAFPNKELLLSFIWLDNSLHETAEVESKVVNLLQRISEKL